MAVFLKRIRSALRAAGIHLLSSLGVGLLAALLVFGMWYPFPYRELSGGRELFLLVTSVDVVCGPLLTLVLFTPTKRRAELLRDLGAVAFIQVGALIYGLSTVWQVRPLFLVMEVDRFAVVSAADIGETAAADISILPPALRPKFIGGPLTVTVRPPRDPEEKKKVLFEAVQGGRDFAQRPEFYVPYEGEMALNGLKRAKALSKFLEKYPEQQAAINSLVKEKKLDMQQLFYLPIRGRQDWVAVLDSNAQIQGYLKGDGFF